MTRTCGWQRKHKYVVARFQANVCNFPFVVGMYEGAGVEAQQCVCSTSMPLRASTFITVPTIINHM
jgi:hypothetical protein